MPEAWITLLKGITPKQITEGLNRVAVRGSTFPPNGAEFRNLCLGITMDKNGNDTTHQHKGAAHIEFNDPNHPSYQPKRIENDDYKTKKRKAGNAQLSGLRDMFGSAKADEEGQPVVDAD